jgi:hypothetical protein
MTQAITADPSSRDSIADENPPLADIRHRFVRPASKVAAAPSHKSSQTSALRIICVKSPLFASARLFGIRPALKTNEVRRTL